MLCRTCPVRSFAEFGMKETRVQLVNNSRWRSLAFLIQPCVPPLSTILRHFFLSIRPDITVMADRALKTNALSLFLFSFLKFYRMRSNTASRDHHSFKECPSPWKMFNKTEPRSVGSNSLALAAGRWWCLRMYLWWNLCTPFSLACQESYRKRFSFCFCFVFVSRLLRANRLPLIVDSDFRESLFFLFFFKEHIRPAHVDCFLHSANDRGHLTASYSTSRSIIDESSESNLFDRHNRDWQNLVSFCTCSHCSVHPIH